MSSDNLIRMLRHNMSFAYDLALQAKSEGEVPVGAVIFRNGELVAGAYNQVKYSQNPVGHAEILAIMKAAQHLKTPMLEGCDIYVTLEPCPMCAAALSLARIRNIYFGAYDSKSGGITGSYNVLNIDSCHHKPNWFGGILEDKCSQMMREFFLEHR